MPGFFVGEFENVLRSGADPTVVGRCCGWSDPDDALYSRSDPIKGDAEGLEGVCDYPIGLSSDPEQDVLGPDVLVVEPQCLVSGKSQDMLRSLREYIDHEASIASDQRMS
jgi:hypothetical protein